MWMLQQTQATIVFLHYAPLKRNEIPITKATKAGPCTLSNNRVRWVQIMDNLHKSNCQLIQKKKGYFYLLWFSMEPRGSQLSTNQMASVFFFSFFNRFLVVSQAQTQDQSNPTLTINHRNMTFVSINFQSTTINLELDDILFAWSKCGKEVCEL